MLARQTSVTPGATVTNSDAQALSTVTLVEYDRRREGSRKGVVKVA